MLNKHLNLIILLIIMGSLATAVTTAGCRRTGLSFWGNSKKLDTPEKSEPVVSALRKTDNLVWIGIVIAAVGVVALVNGSNRAPSILAGGIALVVMSLMILKFGLAIAWVCGIIVVIWFIATLFVDGGFWSLKTLMLRIKTKVK